LSEQQAKVKKTPEELAMINAKKIFTSGIAVGKAQGKSEQRDPLRKRLGVSVNTIAGRKEKGTVATFKQIKTKFNSVDDNREDYVKMKGLFEVCGLYLANLSVPVKKPKGEQTTQTPEPTQ
jgi:hypothetical protein